MGCVQGPSTPLAAQLLRSDLVELRPSQFSLRLRERAISRSDITNRAVRVYCHIEIAIAGVTARYEANLFKQPLKLTNNCKFTNMLHL